MPQFEVFKRGRNPRSQDPYVTIQRRGSFAISASAAALLGQAEAVQLLWATEEQEGTDEKERIVGLRPCKVDDENAYVLRAESKRPDGPRGLAGKDFTEHYGIDTEEGRRYPVYMEDGVLCFKLSTGAPSSRNRTPATKTTEPAHEPTPRDPAKNAAIRQWGITNGLLSGVTPGRIPLNVIAAYEAAHPERKWPAIPETPPETSTD